MTTSSSPFYGCLCLETFSNAATPLPPIGSRQQANPPIPLPEIHFNIWEENATAAFLDIGLMISTSDPAERFEIFLPWAVLKSDIEDLSPRLLVHNGVSAVFNEAWASSTAPNVLGGLVTRTDGSVFAVVPYDKPEIVQRSHSLGTLNSIVIQLGALKAAATAAGGTKAPGQMYVRFRVKKVPPSFYRVGFDQGDALGGGALTRTEIIDFRLNVRRGVPVGIEQFLVGRFLDFSKVQLFLMKSRNQDIVFEDKLFKACRSLEDEAYWAEYILPIRPSEKALKKSLQHVKGSLGYQWKKTPDSAQSVVSEFGMLARFKSFHMRKRTAVLFLLVAVFVGVAGNSVYDLLAKPYVVDRIQSPKVEAHVAEQVQSEELSRPSPKVGSQSKLLNSSKEAQR